MLKVVCDMSDVRAYYAQLGTSAGDVEMSDETIEQATLVVCSFANDMKDAKELLDELGLLD